MAAILVYGTGISSFLFKYFVLFHHPTGATDHVSENDLYCKFKCGAHAGIFQYRSAEFSHGLLRYTIQLRILNSLITL
jgi:hypothetical protein